MFTHADIKDISRDQKLRVMEAAWEEILKEERAPESPDWHARLLEETQSRV
jgi:hypothetical protein